VGTAVKPIPCRGSSGGINSENFVHAKSGKLLLRMSSFGECRLRQRISVYLLKPCAMPAKLIDLP
jgi:hypothetical protein